MNRIRRSTGLPTQTIMRLSSMAAVTALCCLSLVGMAQNDGKKQPAAPPASGSPPAAAAKRSLTVTVPESGDYNIRILASSDVPDPHELPYSFSDKQTVYTFDAAKFGKAPQVAVDNLKTGNSAIKPLPGGDKLELHTADFDHILRVTVKVTYKEKPVKAAVATLNVPTQYNKTTEIKPDDKGTAYFNDVPVGKAVVSVKYGEGLSVTQDVQITSDHPTGEFIVPVAVPTTVPTVDVPAPASTAPTSSAGGGMATPPNVPSPVPAPSQPESNPLIGLLNMVVGLGIVGGAIYVLYRWSKSGGMAATFKKAGIEVSGPVAPPDAGTPWQPNAPAQPVIADPTVCQFCGQKKDPSGNCGCTVGATMGGAGPVIPSQPRLVGSVGVYSGSIFPLNGGSVSIGREPTNGIPLPNDTTVSRRHASIRQENGGFLVADEGSANGVYVNGVKISGTQAIKPGDEVQVGNTRFRFEV